MLITTLREKREPPMPPEEQSTISTPISFSAPANTTESSISQPPSTESTLDMR